MVRKEITNYSIQEDKQVWLMKWNCKWRAPGWVCGKLFPLVASTLSLQISGAVGSKGLSNDSIWEKLDAKKLEAVEYFCLPPCLTPWEGEKGDFREY